jgi:hypothetical protein
VHTAATRSAAPGTSRATRRTAETSWVTVSWVATASARIVESTDMAGGKTYAQLSTAAIAQPTNTKLAGLVAAVFKGETLRSMLLNAYGWWKVSQITYIASLIALGLSGLAFLGSLAGLTVGKRPEIIHEIIDGAPVTHA